MTAEDFKEQLELFKGLRALSDSSFLKRCGNCGRIFETTDQYLRETKGVARGSGLKASFDDDDKTILEVYRNCICGSTLMDFFSDRRDLSERGLKRREIFETILNFLLKSGVPVQEGREEILQFMRTGESKLLERFGVKGKVHTVSSSGIG
jgi:hypothetical protein